MLVEFLKILKLPILNAHEVAMKIEWKEADKKYINTPKSLLLCQTQ